MHIERVPEGAPALPRPSDPPLRFVEAAGARYSYTVEGPGDAPPIILVHGIPGGARDFRYLAPLLAARLRVFRFELPGFGGNLAARLPSPWPRARAEAVINFADALGLDHFALLGHSMGGRTVIEVAGRWPARVRQLVLVASVGTRRHKSLAPPAIMHAYARLARLPGLRRPMIGLIRAAYRKFRFLAAVDRPDEELAWQFELVRTIDLAGARRAVSRIRCPALVSIAEDDPMIERAIADELVDELREAQLLVFETGKHNIQKSRAPQLADAILELTGAP